MKKTPRCNPVAKHAARFQRAQTFRDRSKYQRKSKHKARKGWPVIILMGEQRPALVA